MTTAPIHLRAPIKGPPVPACLHVSQYVIGTTTDKYDNVTCPMCIQQAQIITELWDR